MLKESVGVFREGMSRMVEDLFSGSDLSLLVLCPNGRHKLNINTDKYVPNPAHAGSARATRMLECVGLLMGMSLRAKLCLPFDFPSLVWRQLLGQPVGVADLEGVDSLTVQFLDALRRCEEDGLADDASFAEKYSLSFTTTTSDGRVVELVPGGAGKRVTFSNRLEYCERVTALRLNEFRAQVAAMARGMYCIVPERVLKLFTWREVETLVCGSPVVDVDFFRKHTDYSGAYSDSHPVIQRFWKAMASFTDE